MTMKLTKDSLLEGEKLAQVGLSGENQKNEHATPVKHSKARLWYSAIKKHSQPFRNSMEEGLQRSDGDFKLLANNLRYGNVNNAFAVEFTNAFQSYMPGAIQKLKGKQVGDQDPTAKALQTIATNIQTNTSTSIERGRTGR